THALGTIRHFKLSVGVVVGSRATHGAVAHATSTVIGVLTYEFKIGDTISGQEFLQVPFVTTRPSGDRITDDHDFGGHYTWWKNTIVPGSTACKSFTTRGRRAPNGLTSSTTCCPVVRSTRQRTSSRCARASCVQGAAGARLPA